MPYAELNLHIAHHQFSIVIINYVRILFTFQRACFFLSWRCALLRLTVICVSSPPVNNKNHKNAKKMHQKRFFLKNHGDKL
jgi:hypothetical protein